MAGVNDHTMPASFSHETFAFLSALTQHNERAWFHEHKDEYEQYVREPSLALIRRLAAGLTEVAPQFIASDQRVGGSLMRIHRDVRFSANKQPYKTNIGISLRHRQGKDVHAPGYYVHIAADEVFVGAGIWHPDSAALKQIRRSIDCWPERWLAIQRDDGFSQAFHLAGDSLKRAPKGYAADHPLIEDLKRKDFIALSPLIAELVMSEDFDALLLDYFRAAEPLMRFLCQAIGVAWDDA